MNQVSLYQDPPSGYPAPAIRSQFNNQLATALAMGDPRFNMKQYDRPGLSRGGAQRNQAGIDAAQNLAKGVADAYSSAMQNQAYNSNAQLQGQQGQEQFAQALGGLQEQNNYAAQLAGLQQQQAILGMYSGLLRGLMD